jgi:hypothetical protein
VEKSLLVAALAAFVQPAMDVESKAEFLRTAEVVEAVPAGSGVTRSWRLTLRAGGLTHDAHFQSVDERAAQKEVAGRVELGFVDSYRYNIAAWRLARLLGLEVMVPVSVERRWRSRTGAMTWWVDDVMMDENRMIERGLRPPDGESWSRQAERVKLFSQLVLDTDRNRSNVLITRAFHVWMIDFTRAFRPWPRLRSTEGLLRCDRELHRKLGSLTREDLDAATGDLLEPREIEGILARRDLLLEHFGKLVSERGEAAVLY